LFFYKKKDVQNMLGCWPYATHKKTFFCFSDVYIYICNISWKTGYFNTRFVFPQQKKNTNHKLNTRENQRYYSFFWTGSSSAHVAGLNPAGLAGLLFAALGGRIPATVLLLLIAAHSVVVSFTGGGKSSASMAKDRRPSLLKTGAISI
jgi:hypothetical protein